MSSGRASKVIVDHLEARILAVYRDTIDPLFRYVARNACGDRALAEDVTQDRSGEPRFAPDLSRRRDDVPLPSQPLRALCEIASAKHAASTTDAAS